MMPITATVILLFSHSFGYSCDSVAFVAILLLLWSATMFARFPLISIAFLVSLVAAVPADTHENCEMWADAGECDANPSFMLTSCATSCDKYQKEALKSSKELANIKSFFDLSAKDIDGNLVKFEEFRGKVTILTNVASECGYTESHYKGLVELWSQVKDESIEILAFPCNQFGKQEPGTADEIKKFAKDKGVEFRMMEKTNVNGNNASLVYKYLKKEGGVSNIQWNFATYFVVGPDGSVQAFNGVEPMGLKTVALGLLGKEEL